MIIGQVCSKFILRNFGSSLNTYSFMSILFLVAALKFNTNLKELYLGRNNLNTDDSLHVAGILKNNPHLEVLDLRDNSIQVFINISALCILNVLVTN